MADTAAAFMRFWSPEHEKQFQTYMAFDPNVRTWRNGFTNAMGAPPQIEGGDYNYRAAFLAGDGPRAYAHDTVPHWGSTGKMANHPTEWMQRFVEQFGVDPNDLRPEQVTSAMQQFMQRELVGPNLLQGGN